MFTRLELNVLQQALRNFENSFSFDQELTKLEYRRKEKMKEVANSLAERFEDILNDYNNMENKYIMDQAPFGYDK